MSSLIVELNLPKGLVEVLDVPESQLESKIKELTVLELFRQERISSGKGAELLGMSKWDFIELLGRNNIPYFAVPINQFKGNNESKIYQFKVF